MDTITSPSGQAAPTHGADPALDPHFWELFMRRNMPHWLQGQNRPADLDAQAAADPDNVWLSSFVLGSRQAFVDAVVMEPYRHSAFPAPSGQVASIPTAQPQTVHYITPEQDARQRTVHLIERFGWYPARDMITQSITIGATQALANRIHAPAKTPLRASIRPAGQADLPATASAGMSKTAVGFLSFIGGVAVGAGALWLIKKPRANPYEHELPYGPPS
ncbi:MAG: hypothetical protein WCJ30_25380 [Deltaproteobacteria bacterium]